MSKLPDCDAAMAMAHPTRAAILERLYCADASPVQLAKHLREPLPNVAYHMKRLHKLGAVALTEERQKRGAMEHIYAPTVRIRLTQKVL